MTKEELIEQLKNTSLNDDTEVAHATADSLLVEYIDDEEIAIAYYSINKWYA